MTGWHDRRKAIAKSGLPPSDRTVYRDLLDRASYKTGELDVKWSPAVTSISKRTGLSVRQVKYSLRHLERHGWIKVTGRTSRGHVLAYELLTGCLCDCTGRRHTPVRVQPNGRKGAMTAPSRVQPYGATPQVDGGFAYSHRQGSEGERFCPHGPDCSCWHQFAIASLDGER